MTGLMRIRALKKRVEALEKKFGKGKPVFLNVEKNPDGSLIHDGQLYMDNNALARALGHENDQVIRLISRFNFPKDSGTQ